jgi:hypothetical protein
MNWKHTFRMRDLLSNDTSDENSVRVAKELARRMEVSKLFEDFEGQNMIADLEDIVVDAHDFNGILEDFWDYCDWREIWVPFEERGTWKPKEVAK